MAFNTQHPKMVVEFNSWEQNLSVSLQFSLSDMIFYKNKCFKVRCRIPKTLFVIHKVNNPAAFWKWTNNILVPGLYDVTWYNGEKFEYKEGFISNRENFMVGMPRLRQARIRPGEIIK